MRIHSIEIFYKVVLLLIGIAVIHPVAAATDAPEDFQVIQGVAMYLGVMPAQIIQGHQKAHTEAKMHGGIPAGARRVHVVLALFDNATGRRIEDAQVTGSVMELGLGSEQKKLEPMRIADTVTYGNYFDMPDNTVYHVKVQIRLSGVAEIIEAQFTHRHFAG